MNKIIFAASVLASACATTGRSLPVASVGGMPPTFDSRLAQTPTDDAHPWFPALASDAVLPSASRYQRELSTTSDRYDLVVRVCVQPDGKVSSVDVTGPSGNALLDAAAARDIGAWQFEAFTAPASIRVCNQMSLAYEPTAEVSPWRIPLVRTSGL